MDDDYYDEQPRNLEDMEPHERDMMGFSDDDFQEPELRNQLQFTDKIITPGIKDIIKQIYTIYGLTNKDNELSHEQKQLKDRVKNLIMGFGMITRDYSLSNLDKPKSRNSYEYASFGHGFMSSLIVDSFLFPALFVGMLLQGELNLTRGQDFMQQKAISTYRIEKKYEYPADGMKGRFNKRHR